MHVGAVCTARCMSGWVAHLLGRTFSFMATLLMLILVSRANLSAVMISGPLPRSGLLVSENTFGPSLLNVALL